LLGAQVSSFTAKGLKTAFVSAENCDREVTKGIHDGEYQLVFISPESIISNLYWREMLRTPVYRENLVAFAVDEAHCVSKWLVFDLRGYYMVITERRKQNFIDPAMSLIFIMINYPP